MKNLLGSMTAMSTVVLACGLVHLCAFAQSNPMFAVRERMRQEVGTTICPVGQLVVGLSYSELTVSSDGHVQHAVWTVPACSDPAHAWDWAAPAGTRVRRFSLRPVVLNQLKAFLDRPEVKAIGNFLNAGPGVADYEIEIHRVPGIQRIPVFSFVPSERENALLRLICEAKQIAADKHAAWCPIAPLSLSD